MKALSPVKFMVRGKNRAPKLFRKMLAAKDSSSLVEAKVQQLRKMTGLPDARVRALMGL